MVEQRLAEKSQPVAPIGMGVEDLVEALTLEEQLEYLEGLQEQTKGEASV